ncbi:MAG TPA: carbamoyl-phosphate synthase small subunit [Xanthobacteraceae bacterium]|nr:carbamoyl-phosphate synthase small subunit [Xanthobacteraceae bacterium]
MTTGHPKKSALLVGSSYSAAPLLFALKKRGLHVAVCGNQKDDPCHQYADASFYFDYSHKDDLLDQVRQNSFDFLVPSCNDFAYLACSWAAHNCHFSGYDDWETALTLHTKDRFRDFCSKHDIPAPARHFYGSVEGDGTSLTPISYPVLVKPVDSFSGRGTTKVSEQHHLVAALRAARDASRTGEAVVEEFVEGTLHSHSAFIQDRSIVWDGFVDEHCTVYPYQVNCSNYPSRLSDVLKDEVRQAMMRVIRGASLADGLLHTQFIASDSRFWIIEPMRRCPGDLYGRLIEEATGLNYTDMYVAKFLGERYPEELRRFGTARYMGRHTVSVSQSTVSSGPSFKIPARRISFVPLKMSGERLDPAPFDKMGIAFIEFEDAETMFARVPHLAESVELDSLEETYGTHP